MVVSHIVTFFFLLSLLCVLLNKSTVYCPSTFFSQFPHSLSARVQWLWQDRKAIFFLKKKKEDIIVQSCIFHHKKDGSREKASQKRAMFVCV